MRFVFGFRRRPRNGAAGQAARPKSFPAPSSLLFFFHPTAKTTSRNDHGGAPAVPERAAQGGHGRGPCGGRERPLRQELCACPSPSRAPNSPAASVDAALTPPRALTPLWILQIQGNIPVPLYKRFVAGLYHVYTALEARLEQEALAKPRGEGGIVAPIFFPWELNRVAALEDDLEHWLGAEWRTAPEMEPSPCTKEYVQRLERASAAGIVAHAYTRYMGDLSGGQVLLRKAQKAFGLQRDCTDGLSFYTFSNIEKPKAFKDSYRLELDRLEPERHLAQEIVAEANVVSGLHCTAGSTQSPSSKHSCLVARPVPLAAARRLRCPCAAL
jgi:heme oxygenase